QEGKVMRLMKENGLTVRPRRRFIATTDSNHDGPIFPKLAKNIVPTNLKPANLRDHISRQGGASVGTRTNCERHFGASHIGSTRATAIPSKPEILSPLS